MSDENLWGTLPSADAIRTPGTILREQATNLGELTRNILVGEVHQLAKTRRSFTYEFNIVAPALDNYRITLFRVTHGIQPYPLSVLDLTTDAEAGPWADEPEMQCATETEFKEALRAVLTSEAVRAVVANLLAQSEAVTY